jgi:hypothetical protein
MKRVSKTFVVLASCVVLVGTASARTPGKGLFGAVTLRAGLQGGFGDRTVRWDKGTDETKVKTRTVGLAVDLTFPHGFCLSLFGGMAFTDPRGAIFRHLPISLDYQGGTVRGFAFGAGVRKSLFVFGNFETGARAKYVIFTGPSKTWPIQGFAVDGEAVGKPKWSEFEVGPTLTYKAYENFTPYLGVSLSWFRGDFRMTETLGELGGTQVRKLAQKGLMRVALGASWDLGHGIVIDGEAGLIPVKGGPDIGATVRLLYGF